MTHRGPLNIHFERPSGEPLLSPWSEEERQTARESVREQGGAFETEAGRMRFETNPQYPGGAGFFYEDTHEPFDPDVGSVFWESPTTAGVAETGAGGSPSFNPEQTPGRTGTVGPTTTETRQAVSDAIPEGPVIPNVDVNVGGVGESIRNALIIIVAFLGFVWVLGQAAKGAGRGAGEGAVS